MKEVGLLTVAMLQLITQLTSKNALGPVCGPRRGPPNGPQSRDRSRARIELEGEAGEAACVPAGAYGLVGCSAH